MWHKPKDGDPPGQLKQFIRVCMSCERVYIAFSKKKMEKCPKCTWPSYGAPMVYSGWLKSAWQLIRQRDYHDKKRNFVT